jgi:hypothetical protein
MNTNQLPNFFVVGAPKSGTTSLYIYLKQHPQVFLPQKKELNYFCADLHFKNPMLTKSQFESYYSKLKHQKAIGEVSVWNLLSAASPENIFQFNPYAKIIIVLRNPVDMMYALHSNHIYSGNENILDFEKALAAEEARKTGKMIPENIRCAIEGLFYKSVASYSRQVKKYFDVFGNEKVKVILFDDFVNQTATVFKEVLEFLEVDINFAPEFKAFNISKTTRSNVLKKITTNPPQFVKHVGRILFPHQSAQRDWLMRKLWKLNSKKIIRKEMDAELRRKIISDLTPEIIQLQQMLNRDLSHWLL